MFLSQLIEALRILRPDSGRGVFIAVHKAALIPGAVLHKVVTAAHKQETDSINAWTRLGMRPRADGHSKVSI